MTINVEDLLDKNILPDKSDSISVVQTHISIVLITDNYVYKIKKPVDFGFLDFTTLEKRKFYCHQEVVLNRRFSKDMYLDVLPVLFDGSGYRIGKGNGEVVDYAVKMRRIPDDLLMKSFFEKGKLSKKHLKAIAESIATFHLEAQRSPEIDRFGDPKIFKFTTDENFDQTEKYISTIISRNDFDIIRDWTNNFFIQEERMFYRRISSGKVRDCHGDLHMEHIFLSDPVSMFDCIEFSERLRYMDVLNDIGFLVMDLEYKGAKDHADVLWKEYGLITGDYEMSKLLNFYKVYRAYVRGKVISFQIDDENISPEKKQESAETAKRYFQLARNYIN